MIVSSFCFGQVFVPVSEILNVQVVCFLSIDLVVAIMTSVSINAGEMKKKSKKHLKSHTCAVESIFTKNYKRMLLPSSGRNYLLSECINELLIAKNG